MHLLNIIFSLSKFWRGAKIEKAVLTFLVLYYFIWFVFFVCLPEKDDDEWTMPWTQKTFQKEVKKLSSFHKDYTKVITFVLGFFVATMMGRWWSQISKLPDIASVALPLNAFIHPKPNETEKAKKLKHTILRYCMLSYSLLMVEITRPPTSRKVLISRVQNWFCHKLFRIPKEDKRNVKYVDLKTKELLLSHEQSLFDGKDLDKYWWVPMNWACKLVQTNHEMFQHYEEVIHALTKYHHNLQSLLEYHLNPFPKVCGQAVHVAAWVYLFLSTFTTQTCDGKHEWYWFIISVSKSTSYDDL